MVEILGKFATVLSYYFLVGAFILLVFKRAFDQGIEEAFDDEIFNVESVRPIAYILFIVFWLPMFLESIFGSKESEEDET